MEISRNTRLYSLVTVDPSNHCNHRCRFCYNVFGPPHCMDMDTFHKAIQILPYTQDGHFLLSCLYEPTQNPLFFEMLGQIPRQYKNKVFFTTNLDGDYSDEDFVRLAQSHVHHVNVSLPSLREDNYKAITGCDGGRFFENLRRLRAIFDQHANRPRLQLNTMVIQTNADEVLQLVKQAHEEFRPFSHEVRSPNIFDEGENVLIHGEKDNGTLETELVEKARLDALTDELNALGYKNLYVDTSFSSEYYARNKGTPQNYQNPHDAFAIHIASSGKGMFLMDENPFDLADIDHPFVFFSKALMARQTHQAALCEVRPTPPIQERGDDPDFHGCAEAITIWDERFVEVHGWAMHRQLASGDLFVVLQTEGKAMAYRATVQPRRDVAQTFNDPLRVNTGFTCLIDPRALPYKLGQRYELAVGVLHQGTLYTKHLTDLSF